MIAETEERYYCSRRSLVDEEQVFGTASHVATWFLLQYNEPFAPKILPAPALSTEINARLAGLLRSTPRSKCLFIKRSEKREPGIAFYVVINKVERPLLYKFTLQSYDELLDLDITGLLAGQSDKQPLPEDESLYLVCTHGVHDRCCAKFGLPVYQALAEQVGDQVWQSSHVGGDRFSANVLCFPHGLYYGHIEPEEVGALVDSYQRRQVLLPRLRGRSCYPMPAQAGEFFIREQTGEHRIAALRLQSSAVIDENSWRMSFISAVDGTRYDLEVRRNESALANFFSCNAVSRSSGAHFSLLKYTSS